jgi:hypothetical protein
MTVTYATAKSAEGHKNYFFIAGFLPVIFLGTFPFLDCDFRISIPRDLFSNGSASGEETS